MTKGPLMITDLPAIEDLSWHVRGSGEETCRSRITAFPGDYGQWAIDDKLPYLEGLGPCHVTV